MTRQILWVGLFVLAVHSPCLADQATEESLLDMERKLIALEAEVGQTNLRIDGVSNGVLVQVGLPLVVGVLTFFLGRWDNRRQMRDISDQEIAKWMEKVGHERWNKALKEYLQGNFPGRMDYLLAAAKSIAHEQELQQTKRIRVIGLHQELSGRIVQLLKNSGFLLVEFVPYVKGMQLPEAEIILVDRYSCIRSTQRLEEDDVKALFTAAKHLPNGPFIHYFGAAIQGLPLLMNERAALSSAEFSLVSNLLDQLKFAFPQPK